MNTWYMDGKTFYRTRKGTAYRIAWIPTVIAESCIEVKQPHLHGVQIAITNLSVKEGWPYILKIYHGCYAVPEAVTYFTQLGSELSFCRGELDRLQADTDNEKMEGLL